MTFETACRTKCTGSRRDAASCTPATAARASLPCGEARGESCSSRARGNGSRPASTGAPGSSRRSSCLIVLRVGQPPRQPSLLLALDVMSGSLSGVSSRERITLPTMVRQRIRREPIGPAVRARICVSATHVTERGIPLLCGRAVPGAGDSVGGVRTRCSGLCPTMGVSGAGTSPVSGVRTEAHRCRRRQFASALIRSHPAGGIQHPRVTAEVCARATDRRDSRFIVPDANVVCCSAIGASSCVAHPWDHPPLTMDATRYSRSVANAD